MNSSISRFEFCFLLSAVVAAWLSPVLLQYIIHRWFFIYHFSRLFVDKKLSLLQHCHELEVAANELNSSHD